MIKVAIRPDTCYILAMRTNYLIPPIALCLALLAGCVSAPTISREEAANTILECIHQRATEVSFEEVTCDDRFLSFTAHSTIAGVIKREAAHKLSATNIDTAKIATFRRGWVVMPILRSGKIFYKFYFADEKDARLMKEALIAWKTRK